MRAQQPAIVEASLTEVEIICSMCGRQERHQVWQLAGEDGTYVDPATVPASPPLCLACSETQLRDMLGPEGWARREREAAAQMSFFATLPPGLTAQERLDRYIAHRRDLETSEGEDLQGE
jgi:hypothetical protein